MEIIRIFSQIINFFNGKHKTWNKTKPSRYYENIADQDDRIDQVFSTRWHQLGTSSKSFNKELDNFQARSRKRGIINFEKHRQSRIKKNTSFERKNMKRKVQNEVRK